MDETYDYDVFLSYSSKDRKVVHALAGKLRGSGVRVWLDDWAIQPGDPISRRIQYGLERSRVLLMCMSEAYFASDWAGLEHHSLLFRDPANEERRLIPVLIGDCDRPAIIAQFAYVDWREPSDEAYDRLVRACRLGSSTDEASGQAECPAGALAPRSSPLITLDGHEKGVNTVAVTPDGRRAVSGCSARNNQGLGP